MGGKPPRHGWGSSLSERARFSRVQIHLIGGMVVGAARGRVTGNSDRRAVHVKSAGNAWPG